MKIRWRVWSFLTVFATSMFSGCCNKSDKDAEGVETAKYCKKYTNADFYTDGKFNEEVAFQAYKDMFEFYGVPFTPFLEENMWVTDFGLGDFENVGMGGVFFINDLEHGYFAHGIYLLPGQMIAEHAHFETPGIPAKHEAWMVEKGWIYNCSEVGETTEMVAIPESHGPIVSCNCVTQKVGEVLKLKELKTFHFMKAGDEGAIVAEWASYHDANGLRFTNKKAKA